MVYNRLDANKGYTKVLIWIGAVISLGLLSMLGNFRLFAGQIKTIDADTLNEEIYNAKGKVVILDFWATWCSPCRKQAVALSNIYERYKSDGLSIIGVAMDIDRKKVEKFVNKVGMKYPVCIGDEDTGFRYKINAIPTMRIYDKDGVLVKSHVGFMSEEDLAQLVEDILGVSHASNNGITNTGA